MNPHLTARERVRRSEAELERVDAILIASGNLSPDATLRVRPLATGDMPLCPPCNEGQFARSGDGLRVVRVRKGREK